MANPDEFLEFIDGARPAYLLSIQRKQIVGFGKAKDVDNSLNIIYTPTSAFTVIDSLPDIRKIIDGKKVVTRRTAARKRKR